MVVEARAKRTPSRRDVGIVPEQVSAGRLVEEIVDFRAELRENVNLNELVLKPDDLQAAVVPVGVEMGHFFVLISVLFVSAAATAWRTYPSKSYSPLLPVCRVMTRSRLGTNEINWPPE